MGTASSLVGIDGIPVTPEQAATPQFAANTLGLAEEVSRYPEEFIRKIGVQKAVIMQGTNGVGGEVAVSKHPHTIFLDRNLSRAFDHELSHLVDDVSGCLKDADPTFVNLNPGDIYNGSPDRSHYTNAEQHLMHVIYAKYDIVDPDQPKLSPAALQDEHDRIGAVSEYSFTSGPEDKAENGVVLEQGDIRRYIDISTPPVQAKIKEIAARYYQIDAATTRFLIESSTGINAL